MVSQIIKGVKNSGITERKPKCKTGNMKKIVEDANMQLRRHKKSGENE